MQHHVIIVLGLGEMLPLYERLTRNWQIKYGLVPHIHVVGWKQKDEPFSIKLPRLVEYISSVTQDGDQISVVGISACASASLNAYMLLRHPFRTSSP